MNDHAQVFNPFILEGNKIIELCFQRRGNRISERLNDLVEVAQLVVHQCL